MREEGSQRCGASSRLGSIMPYVNWDTASKLAQAALAGQWNAKNPADIRAVEDLLGKDYGKWIETLGADALRSDFPLIQRVKGGDSWRVERLGMPSASGLLMMISTASKRQPYQSWQERSQIRPCERGRICCKYSWERPGVLFDTQKRVCGNPRFAWKPPKGALSVFLREAGRNSFSSCSSVAQQSEPGVMGLAAGAI